MKKLTLTALGCGLILIGSAQNLISKLPHSVKKEVAKSYKYLPAGTYQLYEPNPEKHKYDTITKAVDDFFISPFEVTNADWKDFYHAMETKLGKDAATRFLPDTTLWQKAFPYSGNYNKPMVDNYFSHPGYANYPVVNITWNQAKAYCDWKTEELNNKLKAEGVTNVAIAVRMPNENEWEYAAYTKPRNYKERQKTHRYLWNLNPYGEGLINKLGYQANFGPVMDTLGYMFKSYVDDGGFYTLPVRCYSPNEKGLYNMRGNAEEWIDGIAANDSTTKGFEKYMFPRIAEDATMRTCKGGSWVDVPYYLRIQIEKAYPANSATPFTGFRLAMTIAEVKPTAQNK